MGENLGSHTDSELSDQNTGLLCKVEVSELMDHHNDPKNNNKGYKLHGLLYFTFPRNLIFAFKSKKEQKTVKYRAFRPCIADTPENRLEAQFKIFKLQIPVPSQIVRSLDKLAIPCLQPCTTVLEQAEEMHQRKDEEKAVKTIQDTAVARNEFTRILDPEMTLD